MTAIREKLLGEFEIRKTKKQKTAFRAWLKGILEQEGYTVSEETGNFSTNVVAGDAEKAKVLLTAHYDTCPVLPFPNFITPRNFLFYILYQFLICIPVFVCAFGGEILVIKLFDAPLWAALATVYIIMGFMLWWIMDGPANKHSANDNTSGVYTLLSIARALPAEERDKVCFVFFDNEEKGLFGSAAFAGKRKAIKKNTLVLNFDCVGDGEHLHFIPTKAVLKDEATRKALETAFLPAGEKTVTVIKGVYPSDQKNFKRGVGVCALKHNKFWGYYMDRIHTAKDTILEEENIAILRDGAVRFVESLNK